MNKITLIEIIASSISIILCIISSFKGIQNSTSHGKLGNLDKVLFSMIFLIPTIAFPLILYYWNEKNFLYYTIIIIYLILQFFTTISTIFPSKNSLWINISAAISTIPFFLSIVILPILFANNKPETLSKNIEKINMNEIENNFSRIKENITTMEQNISNEVQNIEVIGNKIVTQIKEKKDELDKMQIKQIELQNEVDYYKNLSNISKKDADIILATIKKEQNNSKYFDYILGFVIGVIGSILASFIFKRLDKLFNKQPS